MQMQSGRGVHGQALLPRQGLLSASAKPTPVATAAPSMSRAAEFRAVGEDPEDLLATVFDRCKEEDIGRSNARGRLEADFKARQEEKDSEIAWMAGLGERFQSSYGLNVARVNRTVVQSDPWPREARCVSASNFPRALQPDMDPEASMPIHNLEPWREPTYATPPELLQYNRAYEVFLRDTEFLTSWNVVGSARNPPGQTPAGASIRVLMDLPEGRRLCPGAYTPGYRTLPLRERGDRSGGHAATPAPKEDLVDLPRGFVVPLEVFTVAEARAVVATQRGFLGGDDREMDPRYRWLDSIITGIDALRSPPEPPEDAPEPSASLWSWW